MIVILLYSHHLPAWYCIGIVEEILSWSLVGVEGLIMEAQWIPILSVISKWYYPQSTTILHHRIVENYLFLYFTGIKSLLSDLYSILEYILQISESLASGFRHDRTSNGTVNTGNGCRVDPLKIVKVTKMSLRQLSIGE